MSIQASLVKLIELAVLRLYGFWNVCCWSV